jgi:DNA repair protein RecO
MAYSSKPIVTRGIVLSRTDYGEADRIVKFLTPDHGKVTGIAKGVRKSRSKLAGGIEFFSVSDLTFIKGRGEIDTLISTRLINHSGSIVKDLKRTNIAFELIKLTNKITEDAAEVGYFNLLKQAFEALNELELDAEVTGLWFKMQILKLSGHSPDLHTDVAGDKLAATKKYNFHLDRMKFDSSERGNFSPKDIKFLRLGFAAAKPQILQKIEEVNLLISSTQPLVQSMLQNYVRL